MKETEWYDYEANVSNRIKQVACYFDGGPLDTSYGQIISLYLKPSVCVRVPSDKDAFSVT